MASRREKVKQLDLTAKSMSAYYQEEAILSLYFKVEGQEFQSVVFGTLVPKYSPLAKK